MRLRSLAVLLFALLAGRVEAQTVAGFHVDVYANVLDPMRFDFAPTGELFCGRDVFGSGGLNGDPTRVWRIGVGGSPVVAFGAMIIDPDAVAFDALGTFTGVAGGVLVGGYRGSPRAGLLTVIDPNEVTTPLHAAPPGFANPTEMRVDAPRARLLFVDPTASPAGVWQMTSTAYPTQLFPLADPPSYFAIDATGNIFTAGTGGVVRVHDAAGVLVDDAFATLTGFHALEVGPGGAFGTDLYALSRPGGELKRIDASGNVVVVGTGFGLVEGFRFGPDGALYVAEFDRDRIVRITPYLADLRVSATTTLDPAVRGEQVSIQFFVHNAGPDPADGAALRVSLPDPARAALVTLTPPSGACAIDGSHWRCPLGTLAPAATATVTVVVETLRAGTWTSGATATSSTTDPDPANDSADTSALVVDPQLDAGEPDANEGADVQSIDAEAIDAGAIDAGAIDARTIDADAIDAETSDVGTSPTDAATLDATIVDAGASRDAGAPDLGDDEDSGDDACSCSAVPAEGTTTATTWLVLAVLVLRRRRR